MIFLIMELHHLERLENYLSAIQKVRPYDLVIMNAVRPLIRLQNATLCLIGFGNIARNLEKKMLPFFRHIVAYDPYFTRAAEYPEVEFLGFEAAVAKADVISIHAVVRRAENEVADILFQKRADVFQLPGSSVFGRVIVDQLKILRGAGLG